MKGLLALNPLEEDYLRLENSRETRMERNIWNNRNHRGWRKEGGGREGTGSIAVPGLGYGISYKTGVRLKGLTESCVPPSQIPIFGS